MTTLTFDALGFCKALQAGGFTREQAETLVEQQQKAISESLKIRDLATKADIKELEARTDAKLNELKISLIKWIVGSILSLAAFISTVVFGIFAVLPQLASFMRG